MSKPSGFGTPRERSFVQNRCACGCGAYASWGFPGDRWYTRAHIPPALLAPPEPVTPAGAVARPARPAPAPQSLDLFSSARADAGFRPT